MSEIGFGIVGLGMGKRGAQQAAETPGARLVVVCDIVEELAKQQADKWACDWTRDFAEVLSRDDVDAVGIYTPSGMHARMAAEALEAGKHAFTTKPLDIRLAECDRAIRAAEKAGRLLAVDFDSHWTAECHQVKRVLEEGWLGKIFLADLRMKWHRTQEYYEHGTGWRKTLEFERGSAANQGVHFLDLLLWWLGEVEWVYGRAATVAHEVEIEDLSASLVGFTSGAWGVIQTTTAAYPEQPTTIELVGENGTLTYVSGGGVTVTCKQDTPPIDTLALPAIPAHIVDDMLGAIQGARPPTIDGPEGRKSVELFEAIYESSRSEERVTLPLKG